tara:strand:- start:820 stop:1377 length:558 start_codon:yes stop_codon:yes gene_type:complete
MTRPITSQMITELSAKEVELFLAIKLSFDSGTIALWTGYGDITFGSQLYTGAGTLLGLSAVQETPEIAAKGVQITLDSIQTSIVALALTENYQGRKGIVYLGALSSGSVVADPTLIFDGRMDVMSIEDNGDNCSISLTLESRLIDLERARVRRYTPEDQKVNYPNDKGFDFVSDLTDKVVKWGGN